MISQIKAEDAEPTVVILMGPPGSGKGTAAVQMSSQLKIPHISTGEMFRGHMKNNTDLGKQVKGLIDAGKLVPDEIVLDMLKERISSPDCKNGFILDGFPRTVPQAEELNKLLGTKYRVIVLDLIVSDKMIMDRLSGRRTCSKCFRTYHILYNPPKKEGICDACGGELIQRKDDMPEVIQERLKIYHSQTKPLQQFYQQKGNYVAIDGEKKPDEVLKACLQVLQKAPV